MLIMGVAMLLYLAGFAPFRQALQRAMGLDVPVPRRPGGAPIAEGVQGNAHAAAPQPPGGFLHEIQSLLVGFFTSLLPGEGGSALSRSGMGLCLEGRMPSVRRESDWEGVTVS